jgi:hypothetical protein
MKRAFILSIFVLFSCSSQTLDANKRVPKVSSEPGRIMLCDFDVFTGELESTSLTIQQIVNPLKDKVNPSRRCAVTVSQGEKYESVFYTLSRAMDFTLNKPIIKIKILSPRAGVKILCQIKRKASGDCPECPHLNCYQTSTKAGEWEQFTFDFTDQNPVSNWYQRIVLFFDPGEESSGEAWMIDDIEGPDDDISSISLFKRPSSKPYLEGDTRYPWRQAHVTSGVVLGPDLSPDGRWYWYIRGSSTSKGKSEHQTIGVLTQDAATFDPLGKWAEYRNNPVVNVGGPEDWDNWRILGISPVVLPDGTMHMFYKGRPYGDTINSLCGLAESKDWLNFTKLSKDGPIHQHNPADVVYHEGKYYYYVGCWLRIFEDPFQIAESERLRALNAGDGPANFDRVCVYGNGVFRLEGVDKWFMHYYGSSSHSDFPDRMHLATSDDLINWTKVQNDQPLFTRGPHGAWDQGAIWPTAIFEYKDKLYLYYEAWGREGFVADRDQMYFRPAGSMVGVAVVEKDEFLKWCGLVD